MCYADRTKLLPEWPQVAPPICRLVGEVLLIGRGITQKGVNDEDFVFSGRIDTSVGH